MSWATARGTVARVIKHALAAREADDVDLLRATELARLNSLLASVWDRAMAGAVESVRAAFGIVVLRIRLLGLFVSKPIKKVPADWDCCQGPRTLVTRPDDCRWEDCQQHGRFDDA